TLNEFLKYAKIEQDLHDTFRNLSIDSQQPYTNFNRPSLTAALNQSKQNYHKTNYNNVNSHTTQLQRSISQWNSIPTVENRTSMTHNNKQMRNYPSQATSNKKQTNNRSTQQDQFSNCKVCGRKNHRTIDCYYKRTTGCFNCGQNHNIRDCTLPPHFQ
ncbi:unnamed protein product, partial [Rotaria sordida]